MIYAAMPYATLPVRFLHIPKSGGSSVVAAIERTLSVGSLAPQRLDRSILCDFEDFELLRPEARAQLALDCDEIRSLANYQVVAGHFSLDTLLQTAPASSIFTVLREPRARLLSLYLYWRAPGIGDFWEPYRAPVHARRPLAEFLSEPILAPVIDNQICRMILSNDPRLPRSSFAAAADIDAIATDAIQRLEQLGFVGILELGDHMWDGVARLLGTTLETAKVNVAAEHFSVEPPQRDEKLFTVDALDLLEERVAADMLVYRQMLAYAEPDAQACKRHIERAFACQLVSMGDLVGSSATNAAELTATVAKLQAQQSDEEPLRTKLAEAQARLQTQEGELLALREDLSQQKRDADRLRMWLAAIDSSLCWQLTRPMRMSKSLAQGIYNRSGLGRRLNSLLAGRSTSQIWWAALALTSVVALVDAVLTNHIILIPYLAAGPCISSMTGQRARTAIAGTWALILGVLLGVPDEIWGTSLQFHYLLVVAGASLLSLPAATAIARRRMRRTARRPTS